MSDETVNGENNTGAEDPATDTVHNAIASAPPVRDAILTKWVCVMEWMLPDGQMILSRNWADGQPIWITKGMLHESLFASWAIETPEDLETGEQ